MRMRPLLLVTLVTALMPGGASLAPSTARRQGVNLEMTTHRHPSGRDDGTPLEKFRVDLDDPPHVRWKNIMKANREGARATMFYLFSSLPETVHSEVDVLISNAEARLPAWAREEMLGVADALNVTFGDVVIVNLFFEITPFCTCLLYTSPSPRDQRGSRMPSSA